MKVYLASRYSTKEQMRVYASELEKSGIEVTSRWLKETHPSNIGGLPADILSDEEISQIATIDLDDVRRADILVFFSVDPLVPVARGGRHVEFGYALGLGKPILVVGPRENIFHYLPQIKFVSNFQEALNFLL
jgi:nucleoside 2-deoxyribosyltransferase